jgi:hypothetical protein
MTSKKIKDNFGNTEQLCCACRKTKPMKDFYRNSLLKSGFMGKCKVCRNNSIPCPKKNEEKKGRKTKNGLYIFNTTKEDWVKMFQFLQKIGYSLDSPIHEQFCKKHNLPTKKKDKKNRTIKYTPKELGLI